VISLFVPLLAPMARFPLYLVRCGRPPVVGSGFAAGNTYTVPGMPSYTVRPLDTHFFCNEREARERGFHRRDL
jgi:hypothetical protein